MRYVVDRKSVTHDRLQDEVIIINLATGAYYSGSGPAADVWTRISQGASVEETAKKLASEYSCSESAVLTDIQSCIAFLTERGLVQESNGAPVPETEPVLPPCARTKWVLPCFEEYTDMWDLIRFDPIHETDEVGWPTVKK
jgi:hypothetical protein